MFMFYADPAGDPERRATIRRIIDEFRARQEFAAPAEKRATPPPDAPLPDLSRAGGRMSAEQLQRARRGWGGAYWRHIAAEHGEIAR